jgi:hypothetical protein
VKATCGNCGSAQGPFERVHIGNRKTGRVLILCSHGPMVEVKGELHGAGTLACLARRARIDIARWGPGPAVMA